MIAGNTELFDCEIEWTSLDPLKCDIPETYRETAYRTFLLRNDVVATGSLNDSKQRPIYPPFREENGKIFLTKGGMILYAYSTYTNSHLEVNVNWAQERGYGMEILPKRDALYCGNAVTVVLYR